MRNIFGKDRFDKELENLSKHKGVPRIVKLDGLFYDNELEQINKFLKHFPTDNFYICRHGQSILAHKSDRTTYIIRF